MAAIDHLLSSLSSNLDLGASMVQSAQTGASLGQSFRAQDAALTAKAAENRAQNAAAFEMAVRAGKAYGEAQDRALKQDQLKAEAARSSRTLDIQEEQNRLRAEELQADLYYSGRRDRREDRRLGLEENKFDAERQDARREATERANARRAINQAAGGIPVDTGNGQRFSEADLPYSEGGPVSGQGGIDTSLFPGGDRTNFAPEGEVGPQLPSIDRSKVPNLRTTWYDRTEPGVDPNTAKNIGAWSNQLTPNAIALSPDVVKALGAQPGALIEYTTEDNEVGYGVYEDHAGVSKGLTGVMDLLTADKKRVGVDKPVASARVVSQGREGLSGEKLTEFATANYENRPGAQRSTEAAERTQNEATNQNQVHRQIIANNEAKGLIIDGEMEALERELLQIQGKRDDVEAMAKDADIPLFEIDFSNLDADEQRIVDQINALGMEKQKLMADATKAKAEMELLEVEEPKTLSIEGVDTLVAQHGMAIYAVEAKKELAKIPDEKFHLPFSQAVRNLGEAFSIKSFTASESKFYSLRQGLFNMILKERSGAAVTQQEMRRFITEVGDPNKLTAQEFRRRTNLWLDNIAAAYDRTLTAYDEQGYEITPSLQSQTWKEKRAKETMSPQDIKANNILEAAKLEREKIKARFKLGHIYPKDGRDYIVTGYHTNGYPTMEPYTGQKIK